MVQLKKGLSILLFVIFVTVFLPAQEVNDNSTPVTKLDLNNKVELATTALDYHVTPGDIYILNFTNSVISKTFILRVDSSFKVDLCLFGIVDVQDMLYSDFVDMVKIKVKAHYADAISQISIRSVGTFQIQILGEVIKTKLVTVWGLTRLSSVVEQNKTKYASIRNVKVINSDGGEHIYDLFKAERYGNLEQDPYIKLGDKIVLEKYEKQVEISGEVRRPGTYQLLSGESLKDLIDLYGDGLTPYGDKSRIAMTRIDSNGLNIENVKYFDLNKTNPADVGIENLDKVKIASKKDQLSMVFIEGAVKSTSTSTSTSTTSIIKYHIGQGELLSTVINNIKQQILLEADLKNVFIEREDAIIKVDVNGILYDNDDSSDLQLKKRDRIIVPFRQYFVNVSGEVHSPGRYPYIPDRTWKYYVNMAGGFNNVTHSFQKIEVTDYKNNKRSADLAILPEDNIVAPSNDIIYNINRYGTFIGTIASVVTSIILINSYIVH